MNIAWPIPDPIVSKFHLLFIPMSHGRITDAVSLSVVCGPDVHSSKDCVKLALQILGGLRGSSSGTLVSTFEQLVCFHLITRFCFGFAQRVDWFRPFFRF
jgi:hypothetical protein